MAIDGIAVLQQPAIRAFVSLARVARLATATPEGLPHAIPVCYWFDGSNFYFVIDEKPKRQRGLQLKRMRNITANAQIALLIDHYEEDWSQLAYVLVAGRAQVVEEQEEYMEALRNLRDRYPQYRTMPLSRETNLMVRIEPLRVHAWGARFSLPVS
ncbi:MAG TPA: TIGR03668 family PPOX class F420-dependent oxidoreductase [Candidatus Binataceae bacterium]|nr:TIGR03668 family PPOX class F420-dependent oxidoreductase [Candidatus Binataceae bacterium]